MNLLQLGAVDPELFKLVVEEERRQERTLDFVASENMAPEALLALQASPIGNKVVEGMPSRRFHGGCVYVDQIESLAVERAKRLFGADHANVQPHSGVSANLAVYAASLSPGDSILSMAIRSGGHVSHGLTASLPGKVYRTTFYDVDVDSELINYDNVMEMARKTAPKLIVAGSSSYPRAIDFHRFEEIATAVGSLLLVDMAHIAGLVAAGVHKSPIPHADFVTGTAYKTLRGSKGGFILCRAEHARAIDSAVFPGTQGSANMASIAGKALTFRLAATREFRRYSEAVVSNARGLADGLLKRGWRLVAGGTETHIVMVDVGSRDLTGADAQDRLERIGIVSNRNQIPFDTRDHTQTSGLRLGTAAVTARGVGLNDIPELVDVIDCALAAEHLQGAAEKALSQRVQKLCVRFPLYGRVPASGSLDATEAGRTAGTLRARGR